MNRTNFVNPAYLLRIKAAILTAVAESHRDPSRIASAIVLNRLGRESLEVVAHADKGYEVFGGPDLDDDVTDLALDGLRAYHTSQRKQVQTKTVQLDLPGITGWPTRLRPSAMPNWPCTAMGLRP